MAKKIISSSDSHTDAEAFFMAAFAKARAPTQTQKTGRVLETHSIIFLLALGLTLFGLMMMGLMTSRFKDSSGVLDFGDSTNDDQVPSHLSMTALNRVAESSMAGVVAGVVGIINWVNKRLAFPGAQAKDVEIEVGDQSSHWQFEEVRWISPKPNGQIPGLREADLLSDRVEVKIYTNEKETVQALVLPSGGAVRLSDFFKSPYYRELKIHPETVAQYFADHIDQDGQGSMEVVIGSIRSKALQKYGDLPPGLCLQMVWAPVVQEVFQYGRLNIYEIAGNLATFPCIKLPSHAIDIEGFLPGLFRGALLIQHTLKFDTRIKPVSDDQPLYRLGPLVNSTHELRPSRGSKFGAWEPTLPASKELTIEHTASFSRGRQIYAHDRFAARVRAGDTLMMWMVRNPTQARWVGDFLDQVTNVPEREAVYSAGQRLRYRRTVMISVPDEVPVRGCNYNEAQGAFVIDYEIPVPKRRQKVAGEAVLFSKGFILPESASEERYRFYQRYCADPQGHGYHYRKNEIMDGATEIELRVLEEVT